MNVLKRCCFRSLKENRKRTIVTIIGIILATALITGVACMAVSFRASLIAYEKVQNGDYHYLFSGVSSENFKFFQNNKNIKKIGLTEEIGYAVLEGSTNPDKPYVYIRAVDEAGVEAMSLQLAEGRMPENDTELVIGRHIRSNGLVDIKVGDILTFQVGRRMSEGDVLTQQTPYLYEEEVLEPTFEKTYSVVGIIERPNYDMENRMAPGYSVFTYMEEAQTAQKLDVYATYTHWGVRNGEQVTAGILGVPLDLYNRYYVEIRDYTGEEQRQIQLVAKNVESNQEVLKWELLSFSSSTMNMLYAMAALAILIIIVTSVFCIRNSFVISLTEKMKLYGRLASVGTTSKQQKKIVYYEAAFLGVAGIPFGVVFGLFAVLVLVKLVGGMVEDAVGFGLVFDVSFSAILLAIILSAVTIFFSASKSAKKAAKVSPISAIRANDTVKISRKELKCPGLISKIFGIGGKIAYKSLKRAKVKYHTTVVSIVVSVAVFIGMTTFVQLVSFASRLYYEEMQYQMMVAIHDSDAYEKASRITQLEHVQKVDIYRSARLPVAVIKVPFTEDYLDLLGSVEEEWSMVVASLGEEGYERYCKELGISAKEAKDKAIVVADYEMNSYSNGKIYSYRGKVAEYRAGDVIRGTSEGAGVEIEVLLQTSKKPMSLSWRQYNNVVLIVSDEWMDARMLPGKSNDVNVYIRCEDAGSVEESIRNDLMLMNYTVTNYVSQYESERSMYLVISVFLYGFITVVALIGITNIFNTITTNLELRAPEFAMLNAVGMTGREFRRMIWLEGMFYGGKALLFGIPIGVLISYGFHRALGEGVVTAFRFPWIGIAIASGAVVLLLFGIMRYSMGKINRKNIIETIQNENI